MHDTIKTNQLGKVLLDIAFDYQAILYNQLIDKLPDAIGRYGNIKSMQTHAGQVIFRVLWFDEAAMETAISAIKEKFKIQVY